MSEDGVKLKVVVVWIIFIFIFGCMGLFGLFNKDLNKKDKEETQYIPNIASENSMACSVPLDNADIKYDFVLNNDNSIKNIRIAYSAKNGTQENYDIAKKLSNMEVLGVNTTLQNDYTNFLLMIYLNVENIDTQSLNQNQVYFDQLNILVGSFTGYQSYKNDLNNKYGNVSCQDTSKK